MASTTDSFEDVQTPTITDSTPSSPGEHEDSMFPPDNETSYLASPIVRVLVDMKPFTKEFFVHENLICPRSGFFEKTVHGEWKESEERRVSLPEDEPSVFLAYLDIIYAGDTLQMVNAVEWEKIESKLSPPFDWYLHWCKVYVLAKKLMDYDTSDYIAMRLKYRSEDYRTVKDFPSFETVRVIYNGTPNRDPMRLELCDNYIDCDNVDIFGGISGDDNDAAELPPEFLLDLTKHLIHGRPTNTRLTRWTEECINVQMELTKLNNDHKETQTKLESKTRAFKDMKAQCNDAKAKVEAKTQELESKDRLIKTKDRVIAGRDQVIKNKNQAIGEKDHNIKYKDQVIAQHIVEKDQLIKDKDQIIAEKDLTIKTKDDIIADKDLKLKNKDQVMALRFQHIKYLEQVIAENNQLIRERDQLMALKDQYMKYKDQIIAEKTQVIKTKDGVIAQKDLKIRNMDQATWLTEI